MDVIVLSNLTFTPFLLIFVKTYIDMKYFFLIFGLFLLISCKKEKTCTCEHKLNGQVNGVSQQITDKECADLNSTTPDGDTTYTLECIEK